MSSVNTESPPAKPIILSMSVDDDDSCESEYRAQVGGHVKYITISPGTFDRDTLSFPFQSLTLLLFDEEWSVARISRNKSSGDLRASMSNRALAGVSCQWHDISVDCLKLERTKQLTATAFEAISHSDLPIALPSPPIVIAKIASFEWEISRNEKETRAYQMLEDSGLAPRFLAHVHEGGRVIGFLLEKLEGRSASIQDLKSCEAALMRLHNRKLKHGDVNRHNFLVTMEGVKVLDFEFLKENASLNSMSEQLESLPTQLLDESGRGGGFICCDNVDRD